MNDFDQAFLEFQATAQARRSAEDWLAAFETALAFRDAARIGALFHEDCHWRDVLAFTWNLTPVAGRVSRLAAGKSESIGGEPILLQAGVAAAFLFLPAFVLMTALSAAVLMLANIVVAASLNERGVNAVLTPLVIVFSGSLLPLDFFPDALRPFLHVQPFAGLVDIPFRIYFADLVGGAALQGLALQAGWTVVLVILGRLAMERMMRRLEMQGG